MWDTGLGNAVLGAIGARICAAVFGCAAFDPSLRAGPASWILLREAHIVIAASVSLLWRTATHCEVP